MIAFSSSCDGHIDTHIQSESLTENCFREIFKNELRQDVFSFSFIFIFSSSTPTSGSCFTTTSCFHLFFISVLACEAFALDVLRLFFFDFVEIFGPYSLCAQLRFTESLSDCRSSTESKAKPLRAYKLRKKSSFLKKRKYERAKRQTVLLFYSFGKRNDHCNLMLKVNNVSFRSTAFFYTGCLVGGGPTPIGMARIVDYKIKIN